MAGILSMMMMTAIDAAGNDFVFNPVISSNTANYNLRSAAIAAGWDQVKPLIATLTVNAGVYLYASSTGVYALNASGSFPTGSKLTLINYGYIVGCGGVGSKTLNSWYDWRNDSSCYSGYAYGIAAGSPGGSGGPAMITSLPTFITNNGVIGGGGGGGGSGNSGGKDESDGWGGKSWFPGGGGGGGQSYQTVSGGASSSFSNSVNNPGNCTSTWQYYLSFPIASSAGGNGGGGSAGSGGAGSSKTSTRRSCTGYGGAGGNGGGWGSGGAGGGIGGGSVYSLVNCSGIYNQVAGGSPGAGGSCITGIANVTWVTQGNIYGANS